MYKHNTLHDLNFNLFICYRGIGNDKKIKIPNDSGNVDEVQDGKYIGLDVYHELQREAIIKSFFAPKVFQSGDDFKNDLPSIMKNVRVALLILTKGFFDNCFNEDDIVNLELKEIFKKSPDEIKIIPIFVNGYDILSDKDKIIKLYGEEALERFITKSGFEYNGIYSFPSQAATLRSNVTTYLAAYENNVAFSRVDCFSILTKLDEIAQASSVTYALEKIIDALLAVLQDETQTLEEIKNDVIFFIHKLCEKVPHFSSLKTTNLSELISCLNCETCYDARIALEDYKDQKNKIQKTITYLSNRIISKNDRILTFSESKHVINLLNNLSTPIKQTCKIYICEARAKVLQPFKDAKNIYNQLKGFDNNKFLISDNSITTLIEENKINKILLGACGVTLINGEMVNFVNTAGTEIILNIAEKYKIPVFIVSESDKKLNNFQNRETNTSTLDVKQEGYNCDEINYVKLPRTENMIFISEKGLDIHFLLTHYKNDIWKDKRKLIVKDDSFIKCCNELEYPIEKDILSRLSNVNGIHLPKILYSNDSRRQITLEKIEGVRLFELFVVLDYLATKGVTEAIDAKNALLAKCAKQQKIIISEISNVYNRSNLSIYPKIKVVDFIEFFYNAILLNNSLNFCDIDLTLLKNEAEELYERFSYYANLNPYPFRDSTIKNMAIQYKPFENIVCDISTPANLENFARSVYTVLKSKSFDNFKSAKIYDFDFASCIDYTTQYDDLIGLLMHERTYSLQTENKIIKQFKNNEEFLISLIVRYLRFGGRKLSYKFINSSFHSIRFKFDNGQFYFKKLEFLTKKILPDYFDKYPVFYDFIHRIANLEILDSEFDLFECLKTNDDKRISWMGLCNVNNFTDND